MTQRQAGMTSVEEFHIRLSEYERREQREWERARWVAWSIFSPFVGKNKPRTPQQWVKFHWERGKKQGNPIEISSGQVATLNDIYNDFVRRIKR